MLDGQDDASTEMDRTEVCSKSW